MPVNLQTNPLHGALFGDPDLVTVLSDAAHVAAMVRVEAALARVQGRLGIIPDGDALSDALGAIEIAPEDLALGTASDGVPVPALVGALRAALPDALGQGLHWGATSQDIIDTAHVLQYRAALGIMGPRLAALIDRLEAHSIAHADTPMAGRTRSQIAAPTTFGLRVATWAQPLIEAEAGLAELQPRLLKVQFGGAVGANSAVAPHGPAISAGMAEELGLAEAPPWHTDRSGPLALAAWLTSLAAGLARMAGDLILMGRTEIGEARAGKSGASSTMPQKANPVSAEAVVTLARLCTTLTAGMPAAASPVEERDGVAWALEWALLPQALLAAGGALRHARDLADTLAPDPAAMAARLAATEGALAEMASFALAANMPRAETKALVREAIAAPEPLAEALARLGPDGLDWPALLDPKRACAPAAQTARSIFATRRRSI
ncbi:MAG: lyase family protein [Pseudomonadota bacterium]